MTEKTAQKEPGKKPKPQQEVIVHVPLSRLHDFPNHPFKVRDDEAMLETAESIRQYGVLVPAIVRPREDGGYEIVAGHRRKHGSELAGLQNLPCIVREMDDDTATIIMVDSNLQRENILPSERAQAYKMKLEAIRRKAGRPAKTKEKADEKAGLYRPALPVVGRAHRGRCGRLSGSSPRDIPPRTPPVPAPEPADQTLSRKPLEQRAA